MPVPTEEQVPCGRGQIKLVADLSRFRPDVLYERGVQIRRIGELFDGKGRRLSVEKVTCNSEFLSSSVRHDVGEMYGGEMFESYGTTEFGGLVFERPEHSGIHTNSDYVVELLKDREEVAPGEAGEVVIAPKLAKFRSH